jgi:hypothetical protein
VENWPGRSVTMRAGRRFLTIGSVYLDTKETRSRVARYFDVSDSGKTVRVVNRAIRKLPGGNELLDAIETTNAARNHAARHGSADRVVVLDVAIDKLECVRAAMQAHVRRVAEDRDRPASQESS